MAALSEIYVKKEVLEKIVQVLNAKTGEDSKGIKLTVSLSDETNDYGQNVTAYVSQTKEQREAKKEKFYLGNGKVFWTKGETPIAAKKEKAQSDISTPEPTDTPF